MKRPPFKIDGRTGQLRWTDHRDRPQVQSGRMGFLYWRVYAQAVIAGTGRDFTIRLTGKPWHVIEATPDEIKDSMRGRPTVATERMIVRAERIRARRELRAATGRSDA